MTSPHDFWKKWRNQGSQETTSIEEKSFVLDDKVMCPRTKESMYPDTYRTFVNHCVKGFGHDGGCNYETKPKENQSWRLKRRMKR